jgi:mevalonate kinase
MEKKKNEIFYGKVILFGEYGIIYDSMALTIPFTHYHGELSFSNKNDRFKYTNYDFAVDSNKQLSSFAKELNQLKINGSLAVKLDMESLLKDIEKGLFFESTIPQGYGLGSSGALVASVYSRYAKDKIEGTRSISKENILKLKENLSFLENYFHGKSSGIDPLNSYIKFPLLINSKKDIQTVAIPRSKFETNSAIFLVNTGKPGKTEPMVNKFLNNCRQPEYLSEIMERFLPLNNSCIGHLIKGEMKDFFEKLTELSRFQYEYFSEMIPEDFKPMWKHGFESNDYTLKLCGSGGGGYLLGFTQDLDNAIHYFSKLKTDFITVYKSFKA